MLEKIEKLNRSLTQDQKDRASEILSPVQMKALNEVLSADDENAQERLDRLKELLSAAPIAAIRLYNSLNEEQKALIKGLMNK